MLPRREHRRSRVSGTARLSIWLGFTLLCMMAGADLGWAQDTTRAGALQGLAPGRDSCRTEVRLRPASPVYAVDKSTEDVAVTGLNFGFAPGREVCYMTTGMEVVWIGSAFRLSGLAVGLGNLAGEVRGVDVGLFTLGRERYGVMVGAFVGADELTAGLSVALFKNSSRRSYGVFAGGWNDADELAGTMVGAINGADHSYGVQVGGFNSATEARGLQIGIFNRTRSLKGVQIGLINLVEARDGPFRLLPLLNAGLR